MTTFTSDELEKVLAAIAKIANAKGSSKTVSVGEIKKEFELSDEEYDMCIDLSMPLIRWMNEARYWRNKFSQLHREVTAAIENANREYKAPIKEEEQEGPDE